MPQLTVLVVEDHKKQRERLVEMLEELGLAVLTAGAAYEALRIVSEKKPEVVMLDALVPEMHGFEIARSIRALSGDYNPRIVIMTAVYKNLRYQNEARLKYGIQDYLIKPITPEMLASLFETANRTESSERTG